MKLKIILGVLAAILALQIVAAVEYNVNDSINGASWADSSVSNARGWRVMPNITIANIIGNNMTIWGFFLEASSAVNRCYIRNDANTVTQATGTSLSGDYLAFSAGVNVTNGTIIRILCDNSGGGSWNARRATGETLPQTDSNFTWISGANENILDDGFAILAINYSLFDTTTPVFNPSVLINLTSPANNSLTTNNFVIEIANYTVTNGNFTNSTHVTWYQNGTEYNRTTLTIRGNSTNSTVLNLSMLGLGTKVWNTYTCVTNVTGQNVNCSYGPANFSFTIGSVGNFSYTGNTYETSLERFTANITIVAGTSISGASLFYNGTIYNQTTVNLINPLLYSVNTSIGIPLNPNAFANTTRNLFWIIDFVGGLQQNLSVLTQNVSFINLQLCNQTFNIPSLNFTLKNESNFVNVNGSIVTNFQYYLGGDGNVYKNFSYNSTLAAGPANYDFCIYPNPVSLNKNFTANMIMSYTAPDYVERTYYLVNSILTNSTSQVDLLLLPTALAQIFYLDVKRGVDIIDNALVYISKQYIALNSYRTVGLRVTDANGKFIEYLELNKNYEATVVKNGQVLGLVNFTSICATSPCEITLQIPTSAGNIFSSYDETFANNVAYNLTFNKNTSMVTFTYVDVTGLGRYARLLVERISLNNTGLTICDTQLFSVAGTITCNMTGYQGDFKATTYISRSPEKVIDILIFIIDNAQGVYDLLIVLLVGSVVVVFFFWLDMQLGIYSVPAVLATLKLAHFYSISWAVIVAVAVGAVFLAGRVQR